MEGLRGNLIACAPAALSFLTSALSQGPPFRPFARGAKVARSLGACDSSPLCSAPESWPPESAARARAIASAGPGAPAAADEAARAGPPVTPIATASGSSRAAAKEPADRRRMHLRRRPPSSATSPASRFRAAASTTSAPLESGPAVRQAALRVVLPVRLARRGEAAPAAPVGRREAAAKVGLRAAPARPSRAQARRSKELAVEASSAAGRRWLRPQRNSPRPATAPPSVPVDERMSESAERRQSVCSSAWDPADGRRSEAKTRIDRCARPTLP